MKFVLFFVYSSFIVAISKKIRKENDDFILPALLEESPIDSTLHNSTTSADSLVSLVSSKQLETSHVIEVPNENKKEGILRLIKRLFRTE